MDRELIQRLVALEWEFFQATRNEGGRAPCQDDRETCLLYTSRCV